MSIDNITTIAPLSELLPKEKFPLLQYFPQEMQKKIFNDLYFSDSLVYDDAGIVHAAFVLHHKGAIEIPSLDNDLFQIQLGKKDDRGKWYSFNVDISLDINEPAITFEDIGITLFVSDSIIRDKESNKRGRISTNCSLTFSGSGITFDFMKETSLLPAYLFDTDIIVEADSLAFQHDNGNFEGMSISKLRTKVPLDFLTIEGWHNKYLDFVLENVSITKKRLIVQARIDANDIAFPSNTSLSQLPLTFREVGVDIFENEFIEFLLGFEMRMFFLEQVNHPNNILMGIELGKEKEIKVQSKKDEPLLFNLGSDNTLTIDELLGSGSINDDGLDIEAICNSTLKLFGKTYTAEQDLLNYKHTQTTEYFKLGFKNLKFELFGNKELENVSFELHLKKEDEEYLVDTMNFSTSLKWKDIKELIDGNPLNIPDEGKIDAELSFNETDSGTQVIVSLITEFSHLDNLWDFIPDDFKPEVRKCNSTFKLTYDSVNDFQNNPDNVTVELSAKIELKLPDLNAFQIPGFDLIKVTTGDEEGFVTAEYTANYVSDNSEESFNCGMTLTDAFSVDLAMPGTSAENPLVHSTLDKIALKFEDKEQGETQTIGGEILFEGEFEFRPLVPLDFPFASQFNALLHQIGMDDIKGNTKLSLAFDEESFDFEFNGTFEHLGIDVDIFQMLNSLAGSGNVQAENEVQIKFDIGFFLTGFTVHIAQDKDKETQVSFKLDLECSMTGLPPVKAEIELSNEAFSFGITDLSIPLEVPEYPIDIEDLERLQNNDGIWSLEDGTDGKAYIAELEDKKLRLSNLLNIDETTDSGIDRKRVQKDLSHIELKKVMLELIMQVHKLALPAGGDVQPFQTMVETDTWVRSSTLNLLHVDTNLVLNFPEIKFHIPFNNPAGISISGAGKLLGFGEKDALKGLEDLTFKLGLSAEYIFAQIESSGEAIPIPSFGSKYNDGSFSIGKFMIGYGYTKNSFAFDVAGELIIPTKMIADANTSERLGFGIKLPRNNKVSFKLDTIIVQAGPITVPIPLPMFDIDLRTPSAPDITSTQRCTPYWDGLEIIGKNIFHTDFKRLAFSPLFGLSFIPNIKFDADLQIGDANNGLTLVYNDLLIFLGALSCSFSFRSKLSIF